MSNKSFQPSSEEKPRTPLDCRASSSRPPLFDKAKYFELERRNLELTSENVNLRELLSNEQDDNEALRAENEYLKWKHNAIEECFKPVVEGIDGVRNVMYGSLQQASETQNETAMQVTNDVLMETATEAEPSGLEGEPTSRQHFEFSYEPPETVNAPEQVDADETPLSNQQFPAPNTASLGATSVPAVSSSELTSQKTIKRESSSTNNSFNNTSFGVNDWSAAPNVESASQKASQKENNGEVSGKDNRMNNASSGINAIPTGPKSKPNAQNNKKREASGGNNENKVPKRAKKNKGMHPPAKSGGNNERQSRPVVPVFAQPAKTQPQGDGNLKQEPASSSNAIALTQPRPSVPINTRGLKMFVGIYRNNGEMPPQVYFNPALDNTSKEMIAKTPAETRRREANELNRPYLRRCLYTLHHRTVKDLVWASVDDGRLASNAEDHCCSQCHGRDNFRPQCIYFSSDREIILKDPIKWELNKHREFCGQKA